MPTTETVLLIVVAGIVVLILGNIAFQAAAERRNPPIGVFLECDGVRLHYIERGDAAAPCAGRSKRLGRSGPSGLSVRKNPSTYIRVAALLVPKEMRLEVEQKTPGGLDADAYAALRRLLDVIDSCVAIGEPQDVFAMIEEDLRARMAVPIEPSLGETP
jgi:hypothetical protein